MSTPSTTTGTTKADPPRTRSSAAARPLPVWKVLIGSVAVSLGAWVVLSPLAGLELSTTSGGRHQDVGALAVALTTAVVAVAAGAFAFLLRRGAARPRRTFLVVSSAVLVLSLFGPFGSADTLASGLGLVLLHLAVAVSVVPALAAGLPTRRAAR